MIKTTKKNNETNNTKKRTAIFSKATLKSVLQSNPFSATTRQNIIVFFIYIAFTAIVLQLINLQIVQHSAKEQYVNNITHKTIVEKQRRGSIYDRNGKILASSLNQYFIFLDSKIIKNLGSIKELLSKYDIFLNPSHYKAIEKESRYIVIKKGISETTKHSIEKDIREINQNDKKLCNQLKRELAKEKDEEKQNIIKEKLNNLKDGRFVGLAIKNDFKRVYPEKKLASHIIGKVNSENIGTYGIESTCNQQLCGEDIQKEIAKVGTNIKQIDLNKNEEKEFLQPNDITLTIDRQLQFIAEQELEEGLKRTKAKKAIAIIENPHNGEILAMASFPNYNPGEKVAHLENLKNNAIGFSAEPGSTFKIVVLASVLNEGLVKLTDKIFCENGKFMVYGEAITDHDKQGTITVQQILERSSNVGTAKLALKLGEETFYNYIKRFGFSSPTGIDLTGEESGGIRPTNKWSKRSLHTISFGQELFVTPIQTISAYCAIANGGKLIKPKIIKSIGDKNFDNIDFIRQVISEDTAYKVRQALQGVVVNGTGKSAKLNGYSAGGKTGTAQKYDQALKKYSKKNYMASFCGMVPAMNPEFVVLVIVDEPAGDYYASSVTAPIFAKIAQKTAEYLNIQPDLIVKNTNKKGIKK